MIKLDPIIAVKDVEASARWYSEIFEFKRTHGGSDFAVMVTQEDEIIFCLHKWGEHDHPSMKNSDVTGGNGLLLYFRTDNLEVIRKNVERAEWVVEEEIHLNPNSLKKEFTIKDPDGYFLIITEYHTY